MFFYFLEGTARDESCGGMDGPSELCDSVPLFSWGPGDSIVVTGVSAVELELPANAAPSRTELYEYRLHNPGRLWRHQRYVQRPFQLFYAEAQNVWSENIRRTIQVGMGDHCVDRRRALLADETFQYKVMHVNCKHALCIWLHGHEYPSITRAAVHAVASYMYSWEGSVVAVHHLQCSMTLTECSQP